MKLLAVLTRTCADSATARLRAAHDVLLSRSPVRPSAAVGSLVGAIASCLISGCGQPSAPPTAVNNVDYVPHGSEDEITVACMHAALAMKLFTDTPPEDGRDPRAFPGYDVRRLDHNTRASNELLDGIVVPYAVITRLEERNEWPDVPAIFEETIKSLGWAIPGVKKYQANEFAWSNLENRVNWCVDHFKIDIREMDVAPAPAAAPPPPEPKPDPYRTQVLQDAEGGPHIVIEHQPD